MTLKINKMKLSNKRIIDTPIGKYWRSLETPQHIYFVNLTESDENASVKMYTRARTLVSDNYFAYEAFFEDLAKANYTWISPVLVKHMKGKTNIKKKTKKILVPNVGEVKRIAYICS